MRLRIPDTFTRLNAYRCAVPLDSCGSADSLVRAASATCGLMVASQSAGDNLPSPRSRQFRWSVPSIQRTTARRSYPRFRTSFCSNAKKHSIVGPSEYAPTRFIDPRNSLPESPRTNFWGRNWLPPSEWTSAPDGFRREIAIYSAATLSKDRNHEPTD